ncbi:MAG: hypothetical protein LBL49_08085 [Clostridiales Family XIII bacterium]|jgi:hypothetical protein|nr:hypothetical protein [Clostridiales Family XIII bacterium]
MWKKTQLSLSKLSDFFNHSISTEGIKAKLTLAFISAIIRNELLKACLENGLSTNRMTNELNQI